MNNKFSENLKKIRKEHNLSQEQLADELGVSRQAISKWESAAAYPEMDKIIALCDKFNVNIDDLLYKDIKEVKKEEDSKKKINTFIDDFLKFITDSINLFSRMDFKSKVKCLLEQLILLIILAIISTIAVGALSTVFSSILNILPDKLEYFFNGLLNSILVIICIIVVVVILTHVFKTRYLDYYEKFKENVDAKEQDNKIKLEKKDKMVIRDPKHSNYRFINGLFKLCILTVKFFAAFLGISLIAVIVSLLGTLVFSFLVINTGLFFAGMLVATISATIIAIILLLVVLNFIFNRTNDKFKMIWTFILSLVAFGIGCGLVFIGTLNFEVVDNFKIETIEYEMKEELVLYPHYYFEVEYVEEDIDNIKVEFSLDKYCEVNTIDDHNVILINTECDDPITIIKGFLKSINNKKITRIDLDIDKITIYANKDNITKLEENRKKYIEKSYSYSYEN